MKKLIVLLLILIFLLSGCKKNDEIYATNNDNAGTENTIIIDSEQGQTTESETIEEVVVFNTFELSSSEISQIIYGKEVDSFSKIVNGYNIDVFPNGNYLLFCVTEKEADFPSLIYACDRVKRGTAESSYNLIQPFLDTLPTDMNVQYEAFDIGVSLRQVVCCAWIKSLDIQNVPLTIQITPDTDYFLNTDIDEYKRACKEGRYNDIFSDVQTYIDTTTPPQYDNAYALQAILAPIIEDWDCIEVQYDAIEDKATFFNTGVKSINDNIHFVPYATTNEKYIHCLTGFWDSDWLFFENIIISSSDNVNISASRNKIEDVLNGGKIYEAYDITLEDDILEQLLSDSPHTIRFKGKNDNYKDYEMTDVEYEALNTISNFQNVRNILSDLLFQFQEQQPE